MSAAWESESGGGRGVQNPGPRLEGQPSHTGEHASEASPAPVERAGLLSRLSTSLRTGGAAAADTGTAGSGQHSPYGDLEQPLLPGSNEEEQQLAGYSQEPKRWPQLRLSSVSNRRLSPSLLSPTASEGWGGLLQPHPPARQPPVMQQSSQRSSFSQPLLSPRGTGGGFASPFTSTVLTATSATAEEQQQQQQHYPTAPFHTPVLDYQADAGALYDVATGGVGQPGEPVPGRKQGPAVGEAPEAGRYTRAAVTGAVNAVVALPIMLSFAAIIFRVGVWTGGRGAWACMECLRRLHCACGWHCWWAAALLAPRFLPQPCVCFLPAFSATHIQFPPPATCASSQASQ